MATPILRSLPVSADDLALVLAALEAYEPTTSGSESANLAQLLDRVVLLQDQFPTTAHVHQSDNRSLDCVECNRLADERSTTDGHDHLEAINTTDFASPVCARCGLALEWCGDALIVPPEYASEDEHQAAIVAARHAAYHGR